MLNDRLVGLADYPFDRLRTLLARVDAPTGLAPIGMHLGEPKHAPPAFLAETLASHADGWGRYPPPGGTPELIAAIGDWLARRYRLPNGMIDGSNNIVPVAGTREALFLAALAALPRVRDGARSDGRPPVVLLPNPLYAVYYGAAVLAGAEPVLLPATPENGFQPDIAQVAPEILARTGLAYVNSPSNPQGAIAGLDQLKAAIETARAHDFPIAFDECYSEIYASAPPPGGLEAARELGGSVDHVLVFHSLSKRSSAPGLRSGFVAGDADFIRIFKVLRQYGGPTLPGPAQAASAALWRDEAHVAESRSRYREKFEAALEILDGRLGAAMPGGGFFLWLDVGDGEAAAKELWAKGAVQVLPGAYFAQSSNGTNPGQRFMRVALVHETPVVRDGITRIVGILGA
ncbi:MAG: aminotransferase class I/II-fold pyridoxal phosphate-dependent enzyme [Alphaproteobacteria bacterium]|nr:aminotransferase class I/II-fold pyridoxal phosphate-dependent enzyme [Alphaproteobacteria bacterium]MCZ6764716.1 aminotransferase class I/II-fold pyridoxal phosphate-dependent enzyme [Alphaproteobacteria bacterium]